MLKVSINGAGKKHTKINYGRIKGLTVKDKSVKLLKLIETYFNNLWVREFLNKIQKYYPQKKRLVNINYIKLKNCVFK